VGGQKAALLHLPFSPAELLAYATREIYILEAVYFEHISIELMGEKGMTKGVAPLYSMYIN